MRKSLLLVTCLFMSFMLVACKENKTEEQQQTLDIDDTEIVGDAEPIVLDTFEYSLGENFPTLSFDAKAIEYKLTENDKENEMVAAYDILGKDLSINILRYDRNGHSIQEALDAQIEVYYPNQDLVGYVFDTWQNDFYCDYGYYMAYDTATYEVPYYVQTFIFIDGDEFVEADYWYRTNRINIIDNIYFDIPTSLLKENENNDIQAGEIINFESEELSGVPSVSFYKRDYSENDYNQIIEEYQNNYEYVEYEEYSYTENKIDYNNLYLTYYKNEDGNIKYYEFMSIIDSSLYSVCFSNDTNNGLFNAVGIPSILSSINTK